MIDPLKRFADIAFQLSVQVSDKDWGIEAESAIKAPGDGRDQIFPVMGLALTIQTFKPRSN